MSRPSVYLAGAAFALYAAAGAAAFAQPVASPPAPGMHGPQGEHSERRVMIIRNGGHEVRMERGGREHQDMAPHLRAILQLKPAQEGALTAYLAAMKPPEHEMMMMHMRGPGPDGNAPDGKGPEGKGPDRDHGPMTMRPPQPKTTPERLAMMEKTLAEHDAQVHTHLDATRKFYDQLDTAQKRAFDELPSMMMGPMGHGPMMRVHMTHEMPMPPMAPHAPMPPKS